MPQESSQKFIARNRSPRVQIHYDMELYGSEKERQLPFVMGVLADLSGQRQDSLAVSTVADRRFHDIDIDNFDQRMKAITPRLAFEVPNALTGDGTIAIDIAFHCLEDFSPVAVARKVDVLNKLLEARQQLSNLVVYMDGKTSAEQLIAELLRDPALPRSPSEFQEVFKPRTDEAAEALQQAASTLAQWALANERLVSDDALASIGAIIAELDHNLSKQINLILHHTDFQKLEGAWRGLSYLVNNTETDEMLKIRVLDITKSELGKTLKLYKGAIWDQSPLFKKVYEDAVSQPGGEPFGCIIGDYYFDHSPSDVEILSEMSRICAAAHVPFISGASPTVLQMHSWQELANPRDLSKILQTPEYAPWHSLRESEDSRYLALTMPRFLARVPYGAKTNPVDEFAFEEEAPVLNHGRHTWANSAYAMAVNINRSFKLYGWCSRIRGIESGGAVEGLPVYTFPTSDGDVDEKCPTEIAITDRRETELAKMGFIPLIHRKNSDFAAFIGAQSLQKPFEYDDPDATANANLSAQLPYLFAGCRFAHYLMCMVRDRVGAFKERADMERWLTAWIFCYVDGDPAHSSEESKAQKPLAAAEIVLEDVERNPGYYVSKLYIQPHYQLEGLTVSLRLILRLPSVKALFV